MWATKSLGKLQEAGLREIQAKIKEDFSVSSKLLLFCYEAYLVYSVKHKLFFNFVLKDLYHNHMLQPHYCLPSWLLPSCTVYLKDRNTGCIFVWCLMCNNNVCGRGEERKPTPTLTLTSTLTRRLITLQKRNLPFCIQANKWVFFKGDKCPPDIIWELYFKWRQDWPF